MAEPFTAQTDTSVRPARHAPAIEKGSPMARSDHSDRDKAERIERLRVRASNALDNVRLAAVLKGVLDLLADEL